MSTEPKIEDVESNFLQDWFDYLDEIEKLEQNKDSYVEFVRRCDEVLEGDYNNMFKVLLK